MTDTIPLVESHIHKVAQFMLACDQWNPDTTPVDPTDLTDDEVKTAKLRLKLTIEEVEELFEAFITPNIAKKAFAPLFHLINQYISALEKEDISLNKVEIMDAITDIDYVNSGIGVWLNLPLDESFDAVHENNMTKVDKATGKVTRNETGKVLKPENWIPPDLKTILEKHSFI